MNRASGTCWSTSTLRWLRLAGKSRSEFDADSILQKAVLHDLSIVGEAAGRVSHTLQTLQTKHTGVPWRKISDARNFIQHEYFSLDLDIVWQTISYEFAPLRAQIEEILKTEFPGGTTSA